MPLPFVSPFVSPRYRHQAARECLLIVGAITAVTMVVSWQLPAYLPFPTLYVIALGALGWLGGVRVGAVAATVLLANLTAFGYVRGSEGTVLAVGLNAGFRVVLYAVLLAAIWRLRRWQERVWWEARTDSLTGTLNRRAFDTLVQAELARSWRYHHQVCVAYCDVNGFKGFNDEHGHTAGDAMLRQLARVIGDTVRATDVVARIGGDEFAVLFPESEVTAVHAALDRVAEAVRAIYPAGVALGVSVVEPTLDAILEAADRRMYVHKRTGGRLGEPSAPGG